MLSECIIHDMDSLPRNDEAWWRHILYITPQIKGLHLSTEVDEENKHT